MLLQPGIAALGGLGSSWAETRTLFVSMCKYGAGCAGVGKSFLTAAVVDLLKAKGMRVEVTASTGIASVQV